MCKSNLALLLVLLVPASASAEVRWPSGTVAQPFASWAESSAMPLPPGDITVVVSPCPLETDVVASGCTAREWPIFLDAALLADQMREVFLHEIGHQFDWRVLTNADRVRLAAVMHAPWPWSQGSRPSGSEWFAEAYSTCARPGLMRTLSRRKGRVWMRYDWQPSVRRVRQVCSLITTLGRR